MTHFTEKLQEKLRDLQKVGQLAQFLIAVSTSQTAEAGSTKQDFCGGYHPLTTDQYLSGSFLFQWPNGQLSKGNLTRGSLAGFDRLITEAKSAAFTDPFGDNFPAAKPHPQVQIAAEEVITTSKNPTAHLTNWVMKLQSWQERANPKGTQYIGTTLQNSAFRVFSSNGFDLEERGTLNSLLSVYDNTAYFSHSSRELLDPEIVKQKKEQTEQLFSILKRPLKSPARAGKYKIILYPPVFSAAFFELFLANLSGKLVVDGRSKFALADFAQQKAALRSDISIVCDPTQDGKLGAYNFTGEGILSRKEVIVDNGQLVTPLLNAKYARRTKMAPTARISQAMDTLEISTANTGELDKFIKEQDQAILVYHALGMHAQDPITGSYSLPCPHALWIKDGELVGNAPCTITGNFFDDLNNPEAVFLRVPHEHPPALATTANVVFLS